MVLTLAYPMTAKPLLLPHNPVKLLVLRLQVMRQVFKTSDRLVEPGSTRADDRDFAVASTHRFRDAANVQATVGLWCGGLPSGHTGAMSEVIVRGEYRETFGYVTR